MDLGTVCLNSDSAGCPSPKACSNAFPIDSSNGGSCSAPDRVSVVPHARRHSTTWRRQIAFLIFRIHSPPCSRIAPREAFMNASQSSSVRTSESRILFGKSERSSLYASGSRL